MRFPKAFIEKGGLADAKNISGGDLRVWLVLWAHADDLGHVNMSQAQIADLAGIFRSTARDSIDRLVEYGWVERQSKRGQRATYKVGRPTGHKLAGQPANFDFHNLPNMAAPPANYDQKLAGPPAKSYSQPRAHATDVTPQDHLERSARSALTTLRRERTLPLSLDELMTHARALGENGNPWDGYLRIKQATEAALTGAMNPAAVLRARLKSDAA